MMVKSCPECGRFISKKDIDSGGLKKIDIGYDDTIRYVPMCIKCTDQFQLQHEDIKNSTVREQGK